MHVLWRVIWISNGIEMNYFDRTYFTTKTRVAVGSSMVMSNAPLGW